MRLAVMVLNYINYQQTIQCVNKLLENGEDIWITIIDNASPNDSFKMLCDRFATNCMVDVIQNSENSGYAKGNNYGIKETLKKHSEIEYLCIMNPDVEIRDKLYFAHLIEDLDSNSNLAVVSGLIINNGVLDTACAGWRLPNKWEVVFKGHLQKNSKGSSRRIESDGLIHVDAVSGSCFVIRKSIFEDMAFFDENTFMYNEENILAYRIKAMGLECAIDSQCFFWHCHEKHAAPHNKLDIRKRLKFCKIWYQGRKQLLTYYDSHLNIMISLVYIFNCVYFACLEIFVWLRRAITRR